MASTNNTVLRAQGLGKVYARRPTQLRARIGRDLLRAALGGKAHSEVPLEPQQSASEFWAIRDVDLSVRHGDALGIIGLNGSGKTTLLRMLAGQILPDRGFIRVTGRSASMIDLTAGFRTQASGKENIFLRSAALGRSREEVDASLEAIISFSELENAIDAPVATYSSGMTMRLAFSIMLATVPDILFIDEVLAVGDFRFRQKCLAKLREIRGQTSFVMVSHSMADIQSFCSHVVVLNAGQVVFSGTPVKAVEVYESLQFPEPASTTERREKLLAPQFVNSSAIQNASAVWCDANDREINEIRSGEPLRMKLNFVIHHVPRKLIVGVPVWTEDGIYVTGFSTELGDKRFEVVAGQETQLLLDVPSLAFNAGVYVSNTGIMDGPEFLYRMANPDLVVRPRSSKSWGVVSLPHNWTLVQ